jgi:hypothetical protein
MIHAVMVISTQAKPGLLKFYNFQVQNPLSSPYSPPTPLSFFTTQQVLIQFPHRSSAASYMGPFILYGLPIVLMKQIFPSHNSLLYLLFHGCSHRRGIRTSSAVSSCIYGSLRHFFLNFVSMLSLIRGIFCCSTICKTGQCEQFCRCRCNLWPGNVQYIRVNLMQCIQMRAMGENITILGFKCSKSNCFLFLYIHRSVSQSSVCNISFANFLGTMQCCELSFSY